jgi:TatD DNase family protein
MAAFYDTHAHLDFPDFAADLEAVIERATAAGIVRILCVGTTLESSRRVVALAERFPSVYAVVGVHPNHVLEEPEDIRPTLRELAGHPRVVAVGETGLDFYRLGGSSAEEIERIRGRQFRVFEQQLEVAAEAGLNCVIHQRAAFPEALEVVRRHRGRVRTVFHCFTGTTAEALEVVESGSLVSFTGITTFKNAQTVRDALAAVPADRYMLETDCPFLAPVPYRGKRCEPAYVRELAEVVAGVRGVTLEALSEATCRTAEGFFVRLPGSGE